MAEFEVAGKLSQKTWLQEHPTLQIRTYDFRVNVVEDPNGRGRATSYVESLVNQEMGHAETTEVNPGRKKGAEVEALQEQVKQFKVEREARSQRRKSMLGEEVVALEPMVKPETPKKACKDMRMIGRPNPNPNPG